MCNGIKAKLHGFVTQIWCKKSCANANYRHSSIYIVLGIAGCPARNNSDLCQRDPESESTLLVGQVDSLLDWVRENFPEFVA